MDEREVIKVAICAYKCGKLAFRHWSLLWYFSKELGVDIRNIGCLARGRNKGWLHILAVEKVPVYRSEEWV